MIHQVRKRAFESQPQPFRDLEVFGQPAAIMAVPGPSRIPTPQLPTGPDGIGLKAARVNMLPVAGFAMLPFPVQSGR
jgi:hypothetical protein